VEKKRRGVGGGRREGPSMEEVRNRERVLDLA